jgi:pimeloyl-ACP methyl ester carboxylesterase
VVRSYTQTSIGEMLTRRSGDGTAGRPLVFFHAAPGSSSYFEGLMAEMGKDRPVFTFDTPGNGDSAPLGGLPEIWDFQAILGEAIDALGIDEFDVYGSHTGALIAIETAIRMRQRVKRVILDGITLFTPEQTADYLANYPIPLNISSDGGHLLWAWTFRRDMGLWWPWYNRTLDGLRPEGGVAAADLQHAGYVEFMKGGRTYHLSYRAAFAYPTRERMPLVTQPVLQTSTPADPLRAAIPEAMSLTRRGESRIHQGNLQPATHALYRAFLAGEPLPAGPER